MASRLHEYLTDAYEPQRTRATRTTRDRDPIQIDDQDDNDNINEFCTVFVQVGRRDLLRVELEGRIPISDEIADLAEIYSGSVDRDQGRIVLQLYPAQADALQDLAKRISRTSSDGEAAGNPNWFKIAARTASTLRRFVRLIREYRGEAPPRSP